MLVKVPIYIQENIKDLPVGGRLKWFVKQWEEQGAHLFQLDLLKQGYRLPFNPHITPSCPGHLAYTADTMPYRLLY